MDLRIKDDALPPQFENIGDRFTYLLSEYKLGVYGAVLALIALFATGRLGIPSPPSWVASYLLMIALGIIPSMAVANQTIVKWFIPDPRQKVEVWKPDDKGRTISVEHHKIPTDLWNERRHMENGMPVLEPDGDTDAIVTDLEHDDALTQLRVRGVNSEIADPADIMATQGKLEEVYGTLLAEQRDFRNWRATLKHRVQEIESTVVNSHIAAIQKGTTFSAATDVVDEQIFGDYDVIEETAPKTYQEEADDDQPEVVDDAEQ